MFYALFGDECFDFVASRAELRDSVLLLLERRSELGDAGFTRREQLVAQLRLALQRSELRALLVRRTTGALLTGVVFGELCGAKVQLGQRGGT